MTKTLTEQWKNGELLAGLYYFRKNDGLIYIEFHDDYIGFCTPEEYIKEVLSPVPSYDHFSQLVKKVERLQEQLKEAVDFIEELSEDCDNEGILFPIQRKKLEEIEKWGVK